MTDRKSRRVVIINNINSETIDQAIFILKSDKLDRDFKRGSAEIANEAQSIINSYIQRVERISPAVHTEKKRRRRKNRYSAVAVLAVSLIGAAALIMMTCRLLQW